MRPSRPARRLIGLALLACLLAPPGAASSGSRLGGALCFSPQAGIGVVAKLPWWGLRFEGVLAGDSSGGAVQVTRIWPVKRVPFLRYDLESFSLGVFTGIRYSSADGPSLVAGVDKPFRLYPDLHLDLDLGFSYRHGGSGTAGFLGVKAVQDF